MYVRKWQREKYTYNVIVQLVEFLKKVELFANLRKFRIVGSG
jgi:hypothetical protein